MSAGTDYSRWYILPVVETGDSHRPDYIDQHHDALDGYAGIVVDEAAVSGSYAGLVAQFPDQDWYIVRLFATGTDGWQALNDISASYQDTRTLATNPAFVEQVLRERLDLPERSAAEFNQSFLVR